MTSHSLTLYLSPATCGTGSKLKCEGSPTETGQDSDYEEEDSAEWQNTHNQIDYRETSDQLKLIKDQHLLLCFGEKLGFRSFGIDRISSMLHITVRLESHYSTIN